MATLKEFIIDLPAIKAEAKILWGDRRIKNVVELPDRMQTFYVVKSGWEYHLEQLLKSDDPQKYYRENAK